ncbi:MAG: helix-turn-helix transcriptional regulator [Betaproteobacteria bacterium HGW-Betaproteobacteria-8]|nr:MAG: helix-turn-helix transcriptional regulator [Betaproteobacteria bacterium HGW-Betaproteobacteria-8]
MQNLFITPSGRMLADWEGAFASASLYPALTPELIKAANKSRTVIWLHVDGNHTNTPEVLGQILQALPGVRVVVLSNVPSQQDAFHAMSAGASGYCHAYSAAGLLKEVRSVVTHGGLWLGRDLLQQLINVSTNLVSNQADQVADALSKLTQRERDVAVEAAKGLSNKEIARILNITERTVKAHISACFERLQVKDRLQLALILNDKSSRQIN